MNDATRIHAGNNDNFDGRTQGTTAEISTIFKSYTTALRWLII